MPAAKLFRKTKATFETVGEIGGKIQETDGEVNIALTNAVHSSSMENLSAGMNKKLFEGGNPVGFIIQIKNGIMIHDLGDTVYFQDTKTIGEDYVIGAAPVFISGHSGMEP